MYNYDEAQVYSFLEDERAAYAEAGHELDAYYPIWTARMQYDAVALGYPYSRPKHLNELRLELGLSPIPVPPEPTPPTSGDMIDFSEAVITAESPDVRSWPVTTAISKMMLSATGDADIWFGKRNGFGSWPFMPGPEGGDIQYTLWVGCHIGGIWYFAGSILCISRAVDDNYCPTGPTLMPGQLPENWYPYSGSPLATYQPKPGEAVAWLVTAGVQRRNDMHIVAERSNVVVGPFSGGDHVWGA